VLVDIGRWDGRTALVQVQGDVDQDTAALLTNAVQLCLEDSCMTVLLDLTGVLFCDSAGLGALVRADHAANAVGSQLLLVGIGSALMPLLELAGLDQVLSIRPGHSNAPAAPVGTVLPEATAQAVEELPAGISPADSAAASAPLDRLRTLVESHEVGKQARRRALDAARLRALSTE